LWLPDGQLQAGPATKSQPSSSLARLFFAKPDREQIFARQAEGGHTCFANGLCPLDGDLWIVITSAFHTGLTDDEERLLLQVMRIGIRRRDGKRDQPFTRRREALLGFCR